MKRNIKSQPVVPHSSPRLRYRRRPGAQVEQGDVGWAVYGTAGYMFSNLSHIYPWAVKFRGGIIPIYDHKVLLVQELPIAVDNVNGTEIRSFYGFPKGEADTALEHNIIDTALREYWEETGIKATARDFWDPAIVIERPELRCPEVLILFPIVYKEQPDVVFNKQELVGASWFTLAEIDELGIKNDMSTPTRAIVYNLENFIQLCT